MHRRGRFQIKRPATDIDDRGAENEKIHSEKARKPVRGTRFCPVQHSRPEPCALCVVVSQHEVRGNAVAIPSEPAYVAKWRCDLGVSSEEWKLHLVANRIVQHCRI